MFSRRQDLATRPAAVSRGRRRAPRRGFAHPLFALVVVIAIVGVWALPFTSQGSAPAYAAERVQSAPVAQSFQTASEAVEVHRDAYAATKLAPPKPATPSAPVAGKPDPGSAMAIALRMVQARGWDQSQYNCLVALWNKESHWNVYAGNPVSGAYGIPQALPGEKMASAGADWRTNPSTQISWGLGYISGRYGTPCSAWAASERQGWY